MEQMRSEFDAWYADSKNHIVAKEVAWSAWQASRQAVEIDIPEHISQYNMFNGRATPEAANYDEALDDCADAIRAAGLRIKGE